ncbi:MAG: glycosyltransferase [Candidatus Rokuibacteriota bacterium]|nr:MAG: glycosyltransferase [Candidatus Rokubacteria bacterium]
MSGELELSVVVPMFNEVDNVPLLWGELEAALAKMGRRAEIVFVDDGSTDGSGEAVQALMKRDTRVRLLSFEANAGLSAVGYRERRRDRWRKRISSRIANAIRNRVTGDRVRDSACSLRVMRRECLAAIPPFSGMHRFVPTLLRLAGYRVVEVPVNHRPRGLGRSKFGIWNRAWPAFLDLLVVRWMMRRTVRPRIREIAPSDRPQGPGAD